MSSPDPFQELVDSLERVLLHPSSPPVCPAPALPLPSTTPSTSSPIVFASPMARPAPFTGSAEECNGFLLQCTLTIDLHPQMFPTDQSKIAFLITSLTGPALQCAETILNQAGPATQTLSHFLAHFREVFGSSPGDFSVGEQLFQLRQGSMPIHQYSLKFRTLAAASGWNEPSLLTAFRQGLNSRLRLHLATYDDTYGLEKFIQLAIRCSNRLQSCSAESSVAIATPPIRQPEISDPPEPMQTATTAYRLRRDELQIGQLHQEELHLLVLEGSTVDIILGCPWLVQHEPHLSWRTEEVLKWFKSCFPHCFPRLPRPLTTVPVQLPVHSTSVESPVEKQSVNIPSSYSHFSDCFLPQESCPATTASAMGLCDRSIPG